MQTSRNTDKHRERENPPPPHTHTHTHTRKTKQQQEGFTGKREVVEVGGGEREREDLASGATG